MDQRFDIAGWYSPIDFVTALAYRIARANVTAARNPGHLVQHVARRMTLEHFCPYRQTVLKQELRNAHAAELISI